MRSPESKRRPGRGGAAEFRGNEIGADSSIGRGTAQHRRRTKELEIELAVREFHFWNACRFDNPGPETERKVIQALCRIGNAHLDLLRRDEP
jgi:hypothetical protein